MNLSWRRVPPLVIAATLTGCGHTTPAAKTPPRPSEPPPPFHPYTVACVERGFAQSGTELLSVFDSRTSALVGYAELAPDRDGIPISITVTSTSADAVAEAIDLRIFDRKFHRTSLILQDHNLVLEYPNKPDARHRVGKAIRRVRSECG